MSENNDEGEKPVKKAWNSEKGRWGRDRKAASEAGKLGQQKSMETKRKKAAAKKILEDKNEFILEAAAQVTADNPDWFTNMITTLINIAEDENNDPTVRMNAMDKVSTIIGTKAPVTKQVEQTIEDKRTIQETTDELESLGVSISGLRVVK